MQIEKRKIFYQTTRLINKNLDKMKLTKIFAAAIIMLGTALQTSAQDETHDPKAKKIMDDVCNKVQSYSTLRGAFDYTMENKTENIKNTYSGYMFIKGTKYKMILPGTEIFSDGTAMWTYQKDANEITINEVNKDEESALNPTKMFDIYKKGFKYRLEGEKQVNVKVKENGKVVQKSKNCYIIDLYPEKPAEKKFHTIKITIIKETMQVASVVYMEKNGTNFTIDITEYSPNVTMADNLFTYVESRYPGAEVNDMR